MTIRTVKRTMQFQHPFELGNSSTVMPAGEYHVEADEELLNGLSFLAYKRVKTLLYPPTTSNYRALGLPLDVDPDELDAAFGRDQAIGKSTIRSAGRAG